MNTRPRILRKNAALRSMVQEVRLHPSDFIVPIFLEEKISDPVGIESMPGYSRYNLEDAIKEITSLVSLGIKSVLLFVKCPDELKDNEGTEAINPDGFMPRAIRVIKSNFPELIVMSDVALDPFSSYGHDGIVSDGEIVNDATVDVLAKMALIHAQAGVDFVAPSDMMDGRIEAMRDILEQHGYSHVGIMSYAAKYASAFYGPFRDALDSAPGFGDKRTYQMDFHNRKEAMKEVELDVLEGADMIMVKPAMAYLDIIKAASENCDLPIVAYQVSGEYAMLKAAAKNGWLNEQEVFYESLVAIKRAGANLIATYYAKEMCLYLKENNN